MTIEPTTVGQIPPISGRYYYLATPYSKYPDGLGAAFHEAAAQTGKLLLAGLNCYSPIAHTHPIAMAAGINPLDHKIWLPFDEPMMRGACGLIVCMMPTWRDSYGIGEEIKEFTAAGKPIYYLEPL